jgi:hypothetical protein
MIIELIVTTTDGEKITLIADDTGGLTTCQIDKILFDPIRIDGLKLTVIGTSDESSEAQ